MSKAKMAAALFAVAVAVGGCESSAGSAALGGVGGAAIGAGGYEFHLNQEKNRVENDYKTGKIDQREYDIRIDQIRRDSFIQ
jgi:hypothetical protein